MTRARGPEDDDPDAAGEGFPGQLPDLRERAADEPTELRLEDEVKADEALDAVAGREPEGRDAGLAEDFLSDATQIYLHEIGLRPLLTPEEELAYARRAAAGDRAARERMIVHNLRLVVSIAKQYLNRGMPFLDLIEEGNLGMMHALDKFDPERGFRFSTYATWWIRQNIERAIMNQSRTIRLPVHVVKELNTVLRAKRHLEAHGAGDAQLEDIAHLTGRPLEEVRRLLAHNERTASLDAPLDIDPLLSIGEAIADEGMPAPESHIAAHEIEVLVRDWLAQLGEKQRRVIERRFGLAGQEPTTLETLAGELGITRERVRQVQLEALAQLRRILKRRGLTREELL
jgi:RNA polymerase nonessential primary-like sigma factor